MALTYHDARAGQLLHQRVAAGVIEMRVAVQDDFDVREVETEFRHAVANARHGRFKPGIQEDVPLRRGDEKRTDAGRADVMNVADEAKRLERCVPRFPFLFDRRVFGGALFGQGRFAHRDLGREAGEQHEQILLHVHSHVALNPARVRFHSYRWRGVLSRLGRYRHNPRALA